MHPKNSARVHAVGTDEMVSQWENSDQIDHAVAR
jgi:hypothetical protein